MARMTIHEDYLDDKVTRSEWLQFEYDVFAYFPPQFDDTGSPEYGKPVYAFFVPERLCRMVPYYATQIPHEFGGGHGDVRLRYRKATVAIIPMRDYVNYFSTNQELMSACEVLCIGHGFKKGDEKTLKKIGAMVEKTGV